MGAVLGLALVLVALQAIEVVVLDLDLWRRLCRSDNPAEGRNGTQALRESIAFQLSEGIFEGAGAARLARGVGCTLPEIISTTELARHAAMHGSDVAAVGHQSVCVEPDPVDHAAIFIDDDFNHIVLGAEGASFEQPDRIRFPLRCIVRTLGIRYKVSMYWIKKARSW
ncbi:hypothetical protein I6F36_24105 [Bradyrhizobium sp. BRP19]|uniref:hypothetical protein n=1 Tax=Bradyrhizobium sp. BRP19 TaxID=2793823 RepID=UPI001CD3630D|nr:hypothetical protein [Bradyrhizobium sp. BRP19]MCA1549919.1 hypothetical protein [Bradyrhizobium sp. BRP19]